MTAKKIKCPHCHEVLVGFRPKAIRDKAVEAVIKYATNNPTHISRLAAVYMKSAPCEEFSARRAIQRLADNGRLVRNGGVGYYEAKQ